MLCPCILFIPCYLFWKLPVIRLTAAQVIQRILYGFSKEKKRNCPCIAIPLFSDVRFHYCAAVYDLLFVIRVIFLFTFRYALTKTLTCFSGSGVLQFSFVMLNFRTLPFTVPAFWFLSLYTQPRPHTVPLLARHPTVPGPCRSAF